MTPSDSWNELERLYVSAMELPQGERDRFVNAVRGRDPETAESLERLILSYSTNFLEPSAVQVELTAGDRVGPYTLLQRVGSGGMGAVYSATSDSEPERVVALKAVLHNNSEATRRRFWIEQQALASIDHPNLIKLIDSGVTQGGVSYLTTELLEGYPILEYCDREQVALQQRLLLFLDVCRGVQHAHGAGVLHRDIKPENVLVHSRDGVASARLVDFGLALLSGTTERLTRHYEVLGTPRWMSPEQSRPGSDVDERTDIYALGQLLGQLVETAKRGEDALEGGTQPIVRKACADDPNDRYQTVSVLVATIERVLGLRTRRERVSHMHVVCWCVFVALLLSTFGDTVGGRESPGPGDGLIDHVITVRKNKERIDALWPVVPEHRAELELLLEGLQDDQKLSEWEYRRHSESSVTRVAFEELEDYHHGDWLPRVEQRLTVARRLERYSLKSDDVARVWREAIDDIAASSVYQGYVATPQPGLVPLGRNASTGLWEFWHVASGERPVRTIDDQWEITAETGLVMVLVPSGSFVMGESELLGAELKATPNGVLVQAIYDYSLNLDLEVGDWIRDCWRVREDAFLVVERGGAQHQIAIRLKYQLQEGTPIRAVSVQTAFVSKYELTQGQVSRVISPPNRRPESSRFMDPVVVDPKRRPVDGLSLRECKEAARRFGLSVPTEEEWEYVARAGDATIWWEVALTAGTHANFRYNARDDGWYLLSPVGALEPNPWGFHDVLGNAGEWVTSETVGRSHLRGGHLGHRPEEIHPARRFGLALRERALQGGARLIFRPRP